MPTKPINIAAGQTTAHSQAAELQALVGGQRVVSNDPELAAENEALKEQIAREQELRGEAEEKANEFQNEIAGLNGQLDEAHDKLTAEQEAHAKTQAALTAATAA